MIGLISAFFAGFTVKLVDAAEEHHLKIGKDLKILLGVAYGVLIAYTISLGVLPELWLGILLGTILSGKIDAPGHYAGLASLIILLFITGLPVLNIPLLLLFAGICVLEEWLNDNVVDKKKVKGLLLKFLSLRPIMEITAIILAIVNNNVMIFLLLLSFDSGYLIVKKLTHS